MRFFGRGRILKRCFGLEDRRLHEKLCPFRRHRYRATLRVHRRPRDGHHVQVNAVERVLGLRVHFISFRDRCPLPSSSTLISFGPETVRMPGEKLDEAKFLSNQNSKQLRRKIDFFSPFPIRFPFDPHIPTVWLSRYGGFTLGNS